MRTRSGLKNIIRYVLLSTKKLQIELTWKTKDLPFSHPSFLYNNTTKPDRWWCTHEDMNSRATDLGPYVSKKPFDLVMSFKDQLKW
jgi:hypothetical protein